MPLWPLLAGPKPTATQLLLHNSKDSSRSTVHSSAAGRLLLKDGGQGGPLHPRHLHVLQVPEQHRVWRNWNPRLSKSNNYSCCEWPPGTTSSSCVKHGIPGDTTRSVLSPSNTRRLKFDLSTCPSQQISWTDFKFTYFGQICHYPGQVKFGLSCRLHPSRVDWECPHEEISTEPKYCKVLLKENGPPKGRDIM